MTIGWLPVVLGLTAVAVLASTLRPLHKSCHRNHLVLTCRDGHILDFKKLANQILSFNMAVEFIILRSKKTLCNCRIADLMEKIKSTDIVLVTSSQCPWSKIKQCQKKVDIRLPTMTTNGLVIQKNDSKMHWAVRYQMIQQWEEVKHIRSSSLRASVYYGINLDLKRFIAENTDKKTMKEITARVFQQIEANSKFDKNGNLKQAIDIPMEEQLVKDDLELIRQLPDVDKLMNKNDRVLKEKTAEFQTDEELEYTLDNELRDIKTFFPKNRPKKKSKSKRSESLHKGQPISYKTYNPTYKSNASLGHLCRQHHNSCTHYQVLKRIIPRFRRRSKKTKKTKPKTMKKTSRKSQVKPLYIFPYKFYIAGDFVALFDSFAVSTAISKDITMKFKTMAMKLVADLAAERKMQKIMEEAKEKFSKEQKLKAESASSTTTKPPVTTTARSTEDEDEKKDEDRGNKEDKDVGDDDDDDDFDDDWDDEDDENSQDDGSKGGVAVAGIVKKKKSQKKSSNSSAVVKGKGEVKHLSFVSSSKNYDHRIKSFVVFFVAIIGVIIVISVLLIMAVRGKGTLDGMYLGVKSSRQGPSAKTEKETNEREIFQTYGGISDEERLPLLNSMDSRWASVSGDLHSGGSSQSATMNDLRGENKAGEIVPPANTPILELMKSEESPEIIEDPEHETTVQTTSAIERVRAFKAAREDLKRTAPLSATQNIESLKRLHTQDNRPKIMDMTIPENPFPKTQLGGRHVIIDFGKEKTSKGKEVQRIQDPNKSGETSRRNSSIDRSSNNAEDKMYDKGVRSWEGRQERSLVSFLDSIDSQRGRPNETTKKKKSQRRLGFERKSRVSGGEDVDVEVDTVDLNSTKKASKSPSLSTRQKDKQANEAMAADSKNNTLISFTTDDFKIKRLVSSTSDLPLNKYTSLGAIFQNRHMTKTFAGHSYPVVKTPKDKLTTHHVLGPLTPGKAEEVEQTEKKEPISVPMVPPKQFPEAERPDEVRLGRPPIGDDMWDPTKSPHDGVVWPMAWAPIPPYTTPGYQRKGVKQPVGVIQVERVPIGQSKGNTETGTDNLPTWVSPLYRCYGIGGPYGPFGPFYEPPNIDNVETTETAKVLFEPPPPPKKCLLMRVWESFRKKDISAQDKSLAMFLALLDEKLAAIRELLRTVKKDDREMMNDVMNSLSVVFDEARNFEIKMDNEHPSIMTDFDFGDDRRDSLDVELSSSGNAFLP